MRKIVLFLILSFFIGVGQIFANSAPIVTNPIPNKTATEDSEFVFTFAANTFDDMDGDSLTYSAQIVGGGSLPVWLSFDSITRTISGTPTNADVGVLSIKILASDENGGTVNDIFEIYISNTNDEPTVANPIPNQIATANGDFNFQFALNTFSDFDIGDYLSYSAQLAGGGALPPWLSFDSATRTFSGTPGGSEAYDISIEVIANDGNGETITDTFDIIFGAPQPINASCGTAAKTYSYTENNYSGYFCASGLQMSSPIFPGIGQTVSWICAGVNGGVSKSCFATKSTKPPLEWKTYFSFLYGTQDVSLSTSIINGEVYLPPHLSSDSYYWATSSLDLGTTDIDGDDVAVEFRSKNPGGIWAYDTTLSFSTDNGLNAGASFMFEPMVYNNFSVGNTSAQNVNELAGDLFGRHTFKIETKNRNYYIYKDGVLVKQVNNYSGDLGNVNKIVFTNKGSGNIDWVKMYSKGVLILHESFNINGQTTAVLGTGENNTTNYLNPELLNNSENTAINVPTHNQAIFVQTQEQLYAAKSETMASKVIQHPGDKADPVHLQNGEFTYDNTLMSYPSKGIPFDFSLYYSNQAYYNGPVGNNWDFNFNRFLTFSQDGGVNYHNGKLGAFSFAKEGENFEYQEALKATLEKTASGYILNLDNTTKEYFDENGKLKKREDNFGNFISFERDTEGKLIKIIDTNNREYILSYYDHTRLQKITAFDGNVVEFEYFGDSEGEGSEYDLKNILLKNGGLSKSISFTYTKSETFEDAHNILKLIDSKGQVYVENTYENDRVTSQKYGNGTVYYDYTLSEDGKKVLKNRVTNRVGTQTLYTFNGAGLTTQKEIFGKNNQVFTYTYEYDEKGNLIKEILPKGNGFEYAFDEKGNKISSRQKADINAQNSFQELLTQYFYETEFSTPTKIIASNGDETTFELDEKGNIVSQNITENGETISTHFEYDEKGNITKVIDGEGNITQFIYNTSGQLTQTKKGSGNEQIVEQFEYDDFGNIIKKIDGEGNETLLTYSEFQQLKTLTNPLGLIQKNEYDANNNLTKSEIISGENILSTSEFTYDILDKKIFSKTPVSGTQNRQEILEYDANENIIAVKDENNHITEFEYDERGNIVKKRVQSTPEDLITTFEYDENGNLLKQTTGNLVTSYEYDLFERRIKTTSPEGNFQTFAYNTKSQVIKTQYFTAQNVLTNQTEFRYDTRGNILTQTEFFIQNGEIIGENETYFQYNKNSQIIEKTFPDNKKETYEYDSLSRVKKSTQTTGVITTFLYDKRNLVKNQTLTLGESIQTSTFVYDANGNLLKQTFPDGTQESFVYNAFGQKIKHTDKAGHTSEMEYDLAGNVTKITKPGNVVTHFAYNTKGQLIQLTDANGNITTYTYDTLGRLLEEKYPDNKKVTYTYNAYGNLATKQDPNGNIVTYAYDAFQRVQEKNITLGNGIQGLTQEIFTYDTLGRISQMQDNLGNILAYEYDNFGNILAEIQNGKRVAYQYDAQNNQRTQIISPTGNIFHYDYDTFGNLSGVQQNAENIVNYEYQNNIILHKEILGNGLQTVKNYDAYLKLQSLNNAHQTFEYSYDSLGNITKDGRDTYTYDEISRLTKVEYDTLYDNKNRGNRIQNYTYDAIGNRTTLQNTRLIEKTQKICTPETIEETYTDKKGNIKTRTKTIKNCTQENVIVENSQNTTHYTTNELNQYTNIENKNNKGETKTQIDFLYDNNGNLTEDESFTYTYDYKNRLIEMKSKALKSDGITPKTLITYTYDLQDRRISKTLNSNNQITYLYTGKEILLETTTNKNGVILERRENVSSNKVDDIIATNITTYKTEKQQETYTDKKGNTKTRTINVRVPTTQRYFYHKNHLGSITAISNQNGEFVEKYAYDVFGTAFIDKELFEEQKEKAKNQDMSEISLNDENNENISETDEIQIQNRIFTRYNGKGILNNSRLFTGREFDKESKLYYYRARYYDSETGRFIGRDPIGIADDINLYSYVKNNPVMFTDPMGTEKKAFIEKHDATDLLKYYMSQSQENVQGGLGAGYFNYTVGSSEDGIWNLKSNKHFKSIAYDPENGQSCGERKYQGGNCIVFIEGVEMELSDLGNFFLGYNGYHAGFTLNSNSILSSGLNDIYKAGMEVELGNYKVLEKIGYSQEDIRKRAELDEMKDRAYYDFGYFYGEVGGNNQANYSLGSIIKAAQNRSQVNTLESNIELKSFCNGSVSCLMNR